jgi:hypothetical protein
MSRIERKEQKEQKRPTTKDEVPFKVRLTNPLRNTVTESIESSVPKDFEDFSQRLQKTASSASPPPEASESTGATPPEAPVAPSGPETPEVKQTPSTGTESIVVNVTDSGRLAKMFLESWEQVKWILKKQETEMRFLEMQMRSVGTY